MAEPLGFLALRRLGAGLGIALSLGACRDPARDLPPLPAFRGQNQASIARFREADRKARAEPSCAAAVGELAMLYHAYQFLDEARKTYAVARRLLPDEIRFVYYAAKLEKSAFEYEASEALFRQALEMEPDDPELRAELGELYLLWNRREDAEPYLDEALDMDPFQPVAALGKARLLLLDQKWQEVLDLLGPLVERHPRWSRAHQFLAAAHGALGREPERTFHQEQGEYGSAVESPRMRELNELAVDSILEGDPGRGPQLLRVKCARCHDHHRIYDRSEDRRWWARTVRRMQREAGWEWLTDEEAAAVVAYLASRSDRAGPREEMRSLYLASEEEDLVVMRMGDRFEALATKHSHRPIAHRASPHRGRRHPSPEPDAPFAQREPQS